MIEDTNRVTGLDRWTLRVWHVTNIAGWSVAALVAALYFRLGVESAAALLHHSFADSTSFGDYAAFALRVELPGSLLCGGVIGTMLGPRVYRRAQVVAGVVALVYAAAVLLAEMSYPATPAERLFVAAALLVVVPISVWLAGRASRTRPRALRR